MNSIHAIDATKVTLKGEVQTNRDQYCVSTVNASIVSPSASTASTCANTVGSSFNTVKNHIVSMEQLTKKLLHGPSPRFM